MRKMAESAIQDYRVATEPYYLPVGRRSSSSKLLIPHDFRSFSKARPAAAKLALSSTWRGDSNDPLITVACHEDLSSTDLVGRFLLEGEETIWHDGPLTSAVRNGAICYLDEVVEARKDTVVIIHPLTDHRRRLPIEKLGTIVEAPSDFMLVVSYNPGYQSILKDLKQSTRQRFVAIEFDYPPPEMEAEIVAREGGVDEGTARDLVLIGQKVRNLRGSWFGRRCFDSAADLRRTTHRTRHSSCRCRRRRDVLADHRRSRTATQHPRDRDHRDLICKRKPKKV